MDYLGRRYPQLQLHQAEHAPNRVFFHTERSTPTGGINILAIGTLGPGKGTDLLLAALDELRDEFKFEVLFIGDCTPTLMKSLCRRTSPELWARVQFQRRLTPEEVAAALSRTTLLAHPTRADNSPNAVKEAAVMGVPVVASNVGGIPDYITHGQNGLLFPAGDEQSLTRALREAMTHPMFSRGQVDPSSWSKVREDLSPQRMGERFFEAYQLVLNAWGKT